MTVLRNLIVNSMLALVMGIDMICCNYAGFRFLRTFGGLVIFYTFLATFNTHENSVANFYECMQWDYETGEAVEEPEKKSFHFVNSKACWDVYVPCYLYILAAVCLFCYLVSFCASLLCQCKRNKQPKKLDQQTIRKH